MTSQWFMLTVVGRDQPGIVAKITDALFIAGCNFGEASMSRLGGNFTIMLMVQYQGSLRQLEDSIKPAAQELGLHCHFDSIDGHLHEHREPNVRISVYGADRTGIVAHITGTLAKAGLDIYDLETDVAGSEQKPVYIMHIEGHANQGIEALKNALTASASNDITTHLEEIDTVIG